MALPQEVIDAMNRDMERVTKCLDTTNPKVDEAFTKAAELLINKRIEAAKNSEINTPKYSIKISASRLAEKFMLGCLMSMETDYGVASLMSEFAFGVVNKLTEMGYTALITQTDPGNSVPGYNEFIILDDVGGGPLPPGGVIIAM